MNYQLATKNRAMTVGVAMLVTVAVVSSPLAFTKPASAKGFDFFQTVRNAVENHKGPSPTPSPKVSTTKLQQIISRGDAEITRRLQTLAHLNSLIGSASHLSASNKTALQAEVNVTISGLTTLKAKLDADTTVTSAQANAASILSEYRVYALVVPKIQLIRLADDIQATDAKLTAIAGKLQTRIDAAKSAGKDVSALQTKLTDLNAQIAAAQNIAGNMETKVISLQPSDYNTDHKILAGDSAQLRTARNDNQTAYTDAKNITAALKAL